MLAVGRRRSLLAVGRRSMSSSTAHLIAPPRDTRAVELKLALQRETRVNVKEIVRLRMDAHEAAKRGAASRDALENARLQHEASVATMAEHDLRAEAGERARRASFDREAMEDARTMQELVLAESKAVELKARESLKARPPYASSTKFADDRLMVACLLAKAHWANLKRSSMDVIRASRSDVQQLAAQRVDAQMKAMEAAAASEAAEQLRIEVETRTAAAAGEAARGEALRASEARAAAERGRVAAEEREREATLEAAAQEAAARAMRASEARALDERARVAVEPVEIEAESDDDDDDDEAVEEAEQAEQEAEVARPRRLSAATALWLETQPEGHDWGRVEKPQQEEEQDEEQDEEQRQLGGAPVARSSSDAEADGDDPYAVQRSWEARATEYARLEAEEEARTLAELRRQRASFDADARKIRRASCEAIHVTAAQVQWVRDASSTTTRAQDCTARDERPAAEPQEVPCRPSTPPPAWTPQPAEERPAQADTGTHRSPPPRLDSMASFLGGLGGLPERVRLRGPIACLSPRQRTPPWERSVEPS